MMRVDGSSLNVLLKSRGRHMSRSKYQRPEVHQWIGKSGEKFWKVEWRQYVEGREQPKHRAKTWPCSRYTKAKAQEEADKLVRGEKEGPARPDGSTTVGEFWEEVFFPVRKKRVAPNTQQTYETAWRTHVAPVIGSIELQNVTKHAIETVLDRIADAGRSKQTTRVALVIMREMLNEAVENGNIERNPAQKAMLPNCREAKETQSLTVEQVCRLFERTSGRDYVMWRVLILCGLRIGECIALKKSDVLQEGLLVDESAYQGNAAQTKNRKRRIVPLPPILRSELDDWARTVEGDLLFPARTGAMLDRKGEEVTPMLSRGRKALGIPDLTFRQCRTTFATLYRGDPRDLQAALGHSDLKLTMNIYRKPIAERQQAAMDELEARLAGKVVPIKKAQGA
jgi:integrase